MKNLSSLLERLAGALNADIVRKSAVSAAIKECVGGEIRSEDISIKEGILTIHASPALKNELRLKEERVLRCIYEKSGSRIARIIYA